MSGGRFWASADLGAIFDDGAVLLVMLRDGEFPRAEGAEIPVATGRAEGAGLGISLLGRREEMGMSQLKATTTVESSIGKLTSSQLCGTALH